eukprot:TRINITY_DN10349_c1_g1_i1.p1 TRINITY_DN10349_c1_g1~~TRINITY_DN10349_c1_g1_i1.p1  ORF type:complete len:133 (-),score=2.20 TRINITY_DN10349_c1_g1_i1:49-447(-)
MVVCIFMPQKPFPLGLGGWDQVEQVAVVGGLREFYSVVVRGFCPFGGFRSVCYIHAVIGRLQVSGNTSGSCNFWFMTQQKTLVENRQPKEERKRLSIMPPQPSIGLSQPSRLKWHDTETALRYTPTWATAST